MATVINRRTLEFLVSVHTPDFPEMDWIINPTLPDVPQKYWKIDGDRVIAMTPAEKAAVDARLRAEANAPQAQLAETDAWMPRITEDLIDVLVAKKVITLTDLPAGAQGKIKQRRATRQTLLAARQRTTP